MSGFQEFKIIPLSSPSEGQHVINFRANDTFLQYVFENPHQLSIRFTSQNSGVFTCGSDVEQKCRISSHNPKAPFECYKQSDRVFEEVGSIVQKCIMEAGGEDKILKQNLQHLREQEQKKKDIAKTKGLTSLNSLKKRRPISSIKQQPPKKYTKINSGLNVPVYNTEIDSPSIEDLRTTLIQKLANAPCDQKTLFKHCKNSSASNIISILNQIAILENDKFYLQVDKLTQHDITNDKLTNEDRENLCRLVSEAEAKALEIEREKENTTLQVSSQKEIIPTPVKSHSTVTVKENKTIPSTRRSSKSISNSKSISSSRSSKHSKVNKSPELKQKKQNERTSSDKTSIAKTRKSEISQLKIKLKSTIKKYEEKKKLFNYDFVKYKRYYDYLQENEKRILDLSNRYNKASNSKEKHEYACKIRDIHHRKRSEIHGTAKSCADLVQKLNKLRSDIDELSNSIKADYQTISNIVKNK